MFTFGHNTVCVSIVLLYFWTYTVCVSIVLL